METMETMMVVRNTMKSILDETSNDEPQDALVMDIAQNSPCVSNSEVHDGEEKNYVETKTRTQRGDRSEDSGLDVSSSTAECDNESSSRGSIADAIPARVAVAENPAPNLFRPWISDAPAGKKRRVRAPTAKTKRSHRRPDNGQLFAGRPKTDRRSFAGDDANAETPPRDASDGPDGTGKRRARPAGDSEKTVQKRLILNARERDRVKNLVEAMDKLKSVIPTYSNRPQLTQMVTIRIASAYIVGMSRMLGLDYSAEQNRPTAEECFRVVTDLLHCYDDCTR